MSNLPKTPADLRSSAALGAMQTALGASLTAACFATSVTSAAAQDALPIVLPTVEVETTAEQPSGRADQAAAQRRAAAEAAAAETARQEAEAAALAEAKAHAGSSSFADPDAPFKANTLSNSRLAGETRDIARSVTAITQEVLETTGTTSVREIARSTPGLSLGFGEGGNSFGDNLYIRGFKANNDIYQDGIRDTGISVHETFNTEQVEIVKGPAGTVGGRGTTGGALDIVSKSPQDVDFSIFKTEATSAGTVRQTMDINRVMSDGTQVRFNGMMQDGAVAGRDHTYDNRKGAALAIKRQMTDQLTLEVDFSHTEIEQLPDWGVPYVGDDGGPVTEFGVDRGTFYGVVGRDFQEVEQTLGTVKATYDFDNGMTLTNTLRAQRSVNDWILTAPSSLITNDSTDINDWDVAVSFKSSYQETDVLANVNELSGTASAGGLDHNYVLGLSVSREEARTWSYEGLISEDYDAPDGVRGCVVSVVDPDPVAEGCWSGEDPVLGANSTDTTINTVSLYLQDTVDLNSRLTLNGGVRLDLYQIDRSGVDRRSDEAYAYSREDTMVNWNLGATYAVNDDLNVYGAVATSTNPQGQEIASGGGWYGGLDESGQNLVPEQNTSVELGAKYNVNSDLLFTAALFQTTKDKARESQGRGPDAVTTDTLEYYIRGLELGLAGQVTDRFAVFGGATLMSSKIRDSVDSAAIGQSLANIAHEQFSLLGTYDVTEKLMLGARATYTGQRDLGGTASNGNTLASSFVVDVLGEYDLGETASVKFGVTNVMDTLYYDAAYRSGSPFTYVAPGREISVALEMKF
ncbi:TonB-dependent receptor [Thalassovita sp.]|jgi:catecholate siderophore receptor|uniref:TonB-dependent receptor n=1 Tax=Thalassovita sp. TaxID=1979401 RepID=UPI003B5AA46C